MGNFSRSHIGVKFNNVEVVDGGDKLGFVYIKCLECSKDPELFGDAIYHVDFGRLKRGQHCCGCGSSYRYSVQQYQLLITRKIIELDLSYKITEIITRNPVHSSLVRFEDVDGNFLGCTKIRTFFKQTPFYNNLVCGVGKSSNGEYNKSVNGSQTREYWVWRGMIRRCYDPYFLNSRPTYRDCTVSENFKDFQYFAEWCQHQTGWSEEDWHLDKDALSSDGSKEYNEESSVFLPREINGFFTEKSLNDNNVGFWERKDGMLVSTSKINGLRPHKQFTSSVDATHYYLESKKARAKVLAAEFNGKVDQRVIQKLLSI